MSSETVKERGLNVADQYSTWTEEMVKNHVQNNVFDVKVAMEHLQGDFNIGTVIRNANAFGANEVLYCGKRKWDRRGSVGTHHYTTVTYKENIATLCRDARNEGYSIVGLEKTEKAEDIRTCILPEKTLFLIGEEQNGLSNEAVELCDMLVEIPQWGSVRSLNAGVASGIALYEWVRQHVK